ncbi:hypothetical protein [Ruminococcus sp.]|uniref:hypothetical protein n=1 Tax=Ruminococcus sp. TaxID=41978 RepID=UPI0025E3600A|nr:hypothetical protein [Ruminococcus sp.]MCR4640214.1 hypothetical protein [Ruminococcus sp.]
MKKNKILAGLSALVMGATMMAGTAMSASAADVYTDPEDVTTYVGDGGFCSASSGNQAPFGMYDGSILTPVTYDESTGDVEFDLCVQTYQIGGFIPVKGYVSSIVETGTTANLITNLDTSSFSSSTANGTYAGSVVLNVNKTYNLTVTTLFGNISMPNVEVVFAITT